MSSILDALGGGAPPAPPGAGGVAQGAPAPAPQGGGTPGQPDTPDAEQALQTALDALMSFMDMEEDDQDKAVVAKCLASLQGIFGGRQKQDEAAQGITPAHKAMGRAMSGAGGGGGY